MDAVVAMLMTWLVNNTDLEAHDVPLPLVVELSAEALTREYYTDQAALLPASGVDDRIQALYAWGDGENGTIYVLHSSQADVPLSQETGWDNPIFQERLLHELVHHVQFHTGRYEYFACKKEAEKTAYLYGGLFLKQQNVKDPLPNRRVLAHLYSRC